MQTAAERWVVGAIQTSVSTRCIVSLDVSLEEDHGAEAIETLLAACEDSAEDAWSGILEYWGTTEDGCTWRVHVKGAER